MPLPEPSSCAAWPIEWCGDVSGVELELRDEAHEAASRLLWSMTGRRFGVCRVCRGPQPGDSGWCGLPPNRYEPRPDVPALWVDGENPKVVDVYLAETVIDRADWTQAGRWLIRLDETKWPTNTWANPTALMIELDVGVAPPPPAAEAVGELAYELLRSCRGEECALPARAQQITRQGVSMELLTPEDITANGLTGLDLCDRLIKATNPARLQMRSTVVTPERRSWRSA